MHTLYPVYQPWYRVIRSGGIFNFWYGSFLEYKKKNEKPGLVPSRVDWTHQIRWFDLFLCAGRTMYVISKSDHDICTVESIYIPSIWAQ